MINLIDHRLPSANPGSRIKAPPGTEARSLRGWAARVLPGKFLRAALILVAVTLLVMALGRLYWAVNEFDLICVGPFGPSVPNQSCEEMYRDSHHLDIWDAIF